MQFMSVVVCVTFRIRIGDDVYYRVLTCQPFQQNPFEHPGNKYKTTGEWELLEQLDK